jgi:hypothetical protein
MSDFQTPDFVNWPASIDFRPRQTFTPVSLTDLINFVKTATENDRRVRAVGSGWSLSDAAISHDYLISGPPLSDTSAFWSRVLAMSQGNNVWGPADADGNQAPPASPVLMGALTPETMAASKNLVHAEAAIHLVDLYTLLDTPGSGSSRSRWALPTMGGSAGQTLGGAVSTSVHGADFSLVPVPEMVRAIDIVMADGQRHWIERADRPITSQNALTAAFKSDPFPPIIHYDTQEFLAVLVSFGSMGVIYSMVIEVVDQFALSQQVGWTSWLSVRPLLANRTLLNVNNNPPYPGLGGTINPHPTSATDAAGNVINTSNPVARGVEIIMDPYRLSCDYQTDPNPDRQLLLCCRAMFPIANPINGPKPPGADQVALLAALNDFKGNLADSITIPADIQTIIGSAAGRVSSSGFLTGYTITDTYVYPNPPGPLTPGGPELSIEVVVPTRNGMELTFIDQLLKAFDSIIAANLADKFAGIFSIRYCQASEAYQSMHNFGPEHLDDGLVCNIEIGCLHNVDSLGNRIYGDEDAVGLKDGALCESSSEKHMLAFEQLVNQWGARLHWGHP